MYKKQQFSDFNKDKYNLLWKEKKLLAQAWQDKLKTQTDINKEPHSLKINMNH